ncbi:hypothetical protein [Mesorhizobium sp.]|uniref:hypothetical protein n=1 Tax=Mesorhizobium sp. TaxID=1871066 RepID=UPI000FE85F9C|nr:hypothetical protein [Mesorhizobium sp.]RWE44200.1 MAG: hypothetical protein EOS80_19870 [Mesorhizobium sp.]
MEQLSFLSAIEPKRVEAAPLTKMELLAAGLKAQRFAQPDRVDWLREQVRLKDERTRRMECGID